MGDRFYMQQGLTSSDFQLGTFKNKPTKAVVLKEISRVFTFIEAKTFTNTTTLVLLIEVLNWLKQEPFKVEMPITNIPVVNKKQPYIDLISASCNFNDEDLLKLFTVQGLRDFARFINEQK